MQTKPSVPKESVLRTVFRFIIGGHDDKAYRAGLGLVVLPFLVGRYFAWRGSAPFLEVFLVFAFVELGARMWDLQHRTQVQTQCNKEEQLNRLEEIDGALDSRIGEVLAALRSEGGRLGEIKGVLLDLTEQVSALEQKINGREVR